MAYPLGLCPCVITCSDAKDNHSKCNGYERDLHFFNSDAARIASQWSIAIQNSRHIPRPANNLQQSWTFDWEPPRADTDFQHGALAADRQGPVLDRPPTSRRAMIQIPFPRSDGARLRTNGPGIDSLSLS